MRCLLLTVLCGLALALLLGGAQSCCCCLLPPCPGASALGRPLLQALELYGGKDGFQQPLLATVAAILAQPPARQLAAVRGGDADPEAAQALLSLLSCCARLARQWRSVSAPAAVEAVLSLGLPLAAGNTACNHRDTALQAMGTLSAILALVLAPDSPLHSALLCFAAEHGAAILQGVLLALLSLSSAGSSLPKVRDASLPSCRFFPSLCQDADVPAAL